MGIHACGIEKVLKKERQKWHHATLNHALF